VQRVGVLGGTFNPIHIGHLAIAQMALERMHLNKVVFVPTYIPPHKNRKVVAGAKHRFEMVRLAIEDNPFFEISDFEIKKRGRSYTINTMLYFKETYPPDTELFFIIGEDTLSQLPKWKYIDKILEIADFIVVNRPGYIKKSSDAKHHSVIMPGIDISSSYVRMRMFQNKTIKYFVPDKVLDYVFQNKLYGATN